MSRNIVGISLLIIYFPTPFLRGIINHYYSKGSMGDFIPRCQLVYLSVSYRITGLRVGLQQNQSDQSDSLKVDWKFTGEHLISFDFRTADKFESIIKMSCELDPPHQFDKTMHRLSSYNNIYN